MKLSEFLRLLRYVFPLLRAVARDDRDAIYRIEAEVNGIHAQIDARKRDRAGLPPEAERVRPDGRYL